jgi:hypothetical protein
MSIIYANMGCCPSLGYARVNEANAVSERAFLRAVDGTLYFHIPTVWDWVERRVALLSYGGDAELIASEQTRLRESYYLQYYAQLERVAKAYHNAYICCCRVIGSAPTVEDLLNEAQLTTVRDAIVATKSYDFKPLHGQRGCIITENVYAFRFTISERTYEERMAVYRLVAAHFVSAYEHAAAS